MRGWIALLLARKLAREGALKRLAGLVLIAPAFDMTERLMWHRLTPEMKDTIERDGAYYGPSPARHVRPRRALGPYARPRRSSVLRRRRADPHQGRRPPPVTASRSAPPRIHRCRAGGGCSSLNVVGDARGSRDFQSVSLQPLNMEPDRRADFLLDSLDSLAGGDAARKVRPVGRIVPVR